MDRIEEAKPMKATAHSGGTPEKRIARYIKESAGALDAFVVALLNDLPACRVVLEGWCKPVIMRHLNAVHVSEHVRRRPGAEGHGWRAISNDGQASGAPRAGSWQAAQAKGNALVLAQAKMMAADPLRWIISPYTGMSLLAHTKAQLESGCATAGQNIKISNAWRTLFETAAGMCGDTGTLEDHVADRPDAVEKLTALAAEIKPAAKSSP